MLMVAGGDIREIAIVNLDVPGAVEQANGGVRGVRQI
jgi:hypothetical protein